MAKVKLKQGDCIEVLKTAPDNYVDSLVTDPPAGISFMGKDWDGDKGGRDQWVAWMTGVMRECHRVLKPGAYGLVWALPRTSHWTATALENAGFEVRDVVTHLFGSGFPKSMDISKALDKAAGVEREVVSTRTKNTGTHYYENGAKMGSANYGVRQGDFKIVYEDVEIPITAPATDAAKQWQGFGTALKPASEHWILVRKPLSEKTVAANVLKHGTGGINIDASRIAHASEADRASATPQGKVIRNNFKPGESVEGKETNRPDTSLGRFPANLVLDEEAAALLDEQAPECGAQAPVRKKATPETTNTDNYKKHTSVGDDGKSFRGDKGGASRFFYVAKASKKDKGADNTHPTVKSTALMEYLIKLVTPPGGTVLDPFMGSGSTGVAASRLDMGFIGIEQSEEYMVIADKRIKGAS